MKKQSAVWPYDVINEPNIFARKDPDQLKCFLIYPFQPKAEFDELCKIIQDICSQVGRHHFCQINCIRADKIGSAGIIPTEIWHEILTADFIIADVTGTNGNVMIELGVAAACREKENVIGTRKQTVSAARCGKFVIKHEKVCLTNCKNICNFG